MKVIIFTRPDGGVSQIGAGKFIQQQMALGKTEAEALEIVKRNVPADATNIQVVNDTDIPSDRTYRNLWKNV